LLFHNNKNIHQSWTVIASSEVRLFVCFWKHGMALSFETVTPRPSTHKETERARCLYITGLFHLKVVYRFSYWRCHEAFIVFHVLFIGCIFS